MQKTERQLRWTPFNQCSAEPSSSAPQQWRGHYELEAHRDLGDGSRRDTHMQTIQMHIVTPSLIFSILPSTSLISLFPSLSACLGSKQVHQQAKHCAAPQRLSVTFSALGSISRHYRLSILQWFYDNSCCLTPNRPAAADAW